MKRNALVTMLGAVFTGTVLMLGAAGCAVTGDKALPGDLEARIAGQATAEDYLHAAQLYAQRAEALEESAARVENRAETLGGRPYLDPKGLKRASLERLAGTYRSEARDLQHLHAAYRTKAETMFSQQPHEQ